MVNEGYITARIMNISACSVYMGKTYDQAVTVELPDGEIIHLFDSEMLCDNKYINKKAKILIGLLVVKSIEKIKFAEPKIYNPYLESGDTGGNCTGKVEKIIKIDTDYEVLLDVGIGKVMVSTPGLGTERKNVALDYSDLKVGDYLKIEGARFDLNEIELIDED